MSNYQIRTIGDPVGTMIIALIISLLLQIEVGIVRGSRDVVEIQQHAPTP